LVDRLTIPFIASANARGTLPDGDPLCMNAVLWTAQAQADVVLLLGARLNWVFRYGAQFAADASVIQVDVDAAELARSDKVTIGVHSDAGRFLQMLLQQLGPERLAEAQACRDQRWVSTLRERRAQTEAKRNAQAHSGSSPISPLRLAAEVRAVLPQDAITIFDSNLTMAACQRMIPAQVPVSRLTPGTSGCMGVGIPFAIAAKLVHPQRPVVAICGDFAFGLGVMELETAVRHNIAIVIVVANNDGNGGSLRHRMHMHNAGAEPVTMFQRGLRYDTIAGALGCYTGHVEQANDIGPALSRAIAVNRPACINVAVDPDAPFPHD
jgi:2-hydroxyacyl-CoA lyase 1